MIKCETIGMWDVAKNNPLLTSSSEVANYTFITNNGITYLVFNTVVGDDIYKDDVTFPAGTKLRGFDVSAWVNQKLVIDGKHIAYGVGQTIANATVGKYLTITEAGKLAIADSAPESGVYFKITDVGVTLTEKAVKALVCVAAASGSTGATTLADLTDVDTTGATNGQVLKYDSTSTKWKPANDSIE